MVNPLQAEADFQKMYAEQNRRIADRIAHDEQHARMIVDGKDLSTCERCGKQLENRPAALRVVDDKIREQNLAIELKVHPPDEGERMKYPAYMRMKRAGLITGPTTASEERFVARGTESNIIGRAVGAGARIGAVVAGKIGHEAGVTIGRVTKSSGLRADAEAISKLPAEERQLLEREAGARLGEAARGPLASARSKAEEVLHIQELRKRDLERRELEAENRRKAQAAQKEAQSAAIEQARALAAIESTPVALFPPKKASVFGSKPLF